MPMPQGSYQMGAIPGLTLRAWALFNGTTGTIIKASGVTAVNRSAVGTYTLTVSAMPDANVFVQAEVNWSGGAQAQDFWFSSQGTTNTTTVPLQTWNAKPNTAWDFNRVYVAIYG